MSSEKIISKENISKVFEYIKSQIVEQAKEQLSGSEKKSNVDKAVVTFIKASFISRNPLINTLISIVIEYVPVLTQCIYDYLKKYLDTLSEE